MFYYRFLRHTYQQPIRANSDQLPQNTQQTGCLGFFYILYALNLSSSEDETTQILVLNVSSSSNTDQSRGFLDFLLSLDQMVNILSVLGLNSLSCHTRKDLQQLKSLHPR